ncbi:ankyrin repeat-containing domain protein [Aspergillus unguis]
MDPLSITTGIAGLATLAYQIIGYLGTVRSGGKDRLALCNEVTYLWMSITSLLEQLSSENKIPDSLRPLFEPDGVLKEIETQLRELESTIQKQSGHGKLTQTLAWPFTQKDAEKMITRVHRLKSTLQDGINQSTHAVSQAIYRDVQSVKKSVDQNELKELIEWTSPLNFITKQSMIWNQHHKGTCKWFLEREDFKQWREGENTRIFCPGIPGAGKTFLASIVYNELESLRMRGEGGLKDAAVIMLYCKWDDPLSQDVDNLLSSIIKQFVQRYDVGVNDMMELFTKHSKEGTRPSKVQLQSTLELLYEKFNKVFVILDGLDELRDEKDRLPLLKILAPWVSPGKETKRKVNLMVTSRPLPNIVRHFRDMESSDWIECDAGGVRYIPMQYHCAECETQNGVSYDLCPECYNKGKRCGYKNHTYYFQLNARIIPISAVEEDLTTYVRWRTSASDFLQECVDSKEGLMDAILETVVRSNGGMFLLAKFNMDTLESKLNPKQLLAALKTLPQELDGTYADAMQRVNELKPSTRETVLRFLCWVVFAEEPLHMRAIEHALAVREGDTDIDDDEIIRARTLADKCAGLVHLDESDCLRLVHYSAEGFFSRTRAQWFPDRGVGVTSTCLTYLSFDAFRAGACDGPSEADDFEKRLEKYPFLRYASINWGKHLRAAEDNTLYDRALTLLTDSGCLGTITQALWYLEDQQQAMSWSAKNGSAIHLAAHFNLDLLISQLISKGYDPNVRDINGATPLSLAVQRGHVNAVQALLKARVSLNTVDNSGRSPLHYSVYFNHPVVAKLLIDEEDIDVNVASAKWSGYNPLMVAAASGLTECLELLLAHKNIDVNQECIRPQGGTALIFAAQQGETGTTKALLTHPDLNINHADYSGSTALTWAAQDGFYEIVEALLNNGADTEVEQDGTKGTAIMRAIDTNHVSVVKLLIQHGANVHQKDCFERGLLHSAAVNQRAEIIRILLKHDPTLDVNMQDVNGMTTMHDIARSGNLETIEVLLEHGGDPTIKDIHGRTPILIAHECHHPAALETFRAARLRQKAEGKGQIQRTGSGSIDDGVKRSDTGMSIPGTLPLWSLVVSKKYTELKERLPDCTPDEINSVEPDMGQSALHWAIAHRDEASTKLLIQHGADINLRSRYGRTPIHLAVMDNHFGLARILLRAGADTNINDIWDVPPLAMAGPIGILLIEHGADLTREGIDKEFFLRTAAQFGMEKAVRRLIAAGARVWMKGANGQTPYMVAKESGYGELANLILQLSPRPEDSEDVKEEEEKKDVSKDEGEKEHVNEEEEERVPKEEKHEREPKDEKRKTMSGPTAVHSGGKTDGLMNRHLYTLILVLIVITATTLVRMY